MEFLRLNKGDTVVYKYNFPYKLSNGQEVNEEGEELIIKSDVSVKSKFFNLKEKYVEIKEKKLEEMNKDELLKFAQDKKIDVDNRKGEKKLLEEIKNKLK